MMVPALAMIDTTHHAPSVSMKTCRWWLLALLLPLGCGCASSSSFLPSNHDRTASFRRDAFWIWDDQPSKPNSWMIFRRHMHIPSLAVYNQTQTVSVQLQAKIAVDSKYWLWACWHHSSSPSEEDHHWRDSTFYNGNETLLLVREGGLKRGPTPRDTWYDTVNLHVPYHHHHHHHQHSGTKRNATLSIQILVWYFGKNGFSHKDSGHGGLLLDGTVSVANTALWQRPLVTDLQWSVQSHPGFGSEDAGDTPNYRLAEHNIYYDARRKQAPPPPLQPALQLGQAGSKPWNQLWPRRIPQWKDFPLQDYASVQVETFPNGTIILHARLWYNTQFYPWILLPPLHSKDSNNTSIRVDIQTDNYQYHKPNKHKQSSDPIYLRATFLTHATSSESQSFESPSWINGHVVTYRIHYYTGTTTPTASIQVPRVMYRETRYDASLTGRFHSNDEFLNTLWAKAQRTLLVNMRDNFMDCPDRERAQWWGDVTLEIGQAMYALGNRAKALARKAISDLVHWQQQDKQQKCDKLHAPVPEGNYPRELPLQMLASIGWYGIYTYYWYTGDSETVKDAYPHVRSYLRTCWSMNATTGLINHRHGDWDWGDWGQNADVPILDNAWYVLALRAAIPMARVAGFEQQDVGHWQAQLKKIQQNFDVPTRRFPQIVKVLMTQRFWASPYMEKYVLESLFKMKHADEALQRMKHRYQAMVMAPNITTLWEQWDLNSGSYNHAWAGGPLTLLSEYVAGIAPTSPGWRTFHVMPNDSRNLTRLKATVPVSNDGNDAIIHVSIRKRKDKGGKHCFYRLDLSSPNNTLATVGIPREVKFRENTCRLGTVQVNNVVLWNVSEGKLLTRPLARVEGVSLMNVTETHVLCQASPGHVQLKGVAKCTSNRNTTIIKAITY
ncbi:Bacterial alpha-L-rhamnosidase [Seminavis robusta]|uniref:Bacterial alpha-L-rhamnosidase n=1 Tax=Seminavis robusta TaxID=568900 RepID=A0A9N8HXT8_9STRA|nr:Bacterial alpha-L-rhamnosidase [Seminavis robusta]|eukprot:Sro2571_g331590.1 Bacterial alpha-L-rhamnosidase (893) ;mRNA; f:9614-12387